VSGCVRAREASTISVRIVGKQEVIQLSEDDESNLGLGRGPGADLWAVDPALLRSVYRFASPALACWPVSP
jgi:hypothetical protein